MAGLMPIMWSSGTGSEVMKRIATPMVGGMVSATLLTLVVVPAIYGIWKGIGLPANPPETEEGKNKPDKDMGEGAALYE
jgi:Cu(I)/Ag(I) efflux system membrane protein CusA/SilA